MADLKDVIEAIFTNLIEARYKADQYSSDISAEYSESGRLVNFNTPSIDIGNAQINIKFSIKEEDTVQDEPTLDRSILIEKLSGSTQQALNNTRLKLKDTSNTLAIKSGISNNIAQEVMKYVDLDSLSIDQTKALPAINTLLKQHLGKAANGRSIGTRTVNDVFTEAINEAQKEMLIAREQLKKEQVKAPKMIVDIDQLKAVDPNLISSITLDVDLNTIDQFRVGGQQLEL